MGRGITEFLNLLVTLLPPWALALVAVVVLAVGIPGYRYSMKHRRIQSLVRRMVRASPAAKAKLEDEAFAAAGRNPHLLALLARNARNRSLPHVRQRALDALAPFPEQLAKVQGDIRPPKVPVDHPTIEVLQIEHVLERQLWERARERIEAGRLAWPNSPVWDDLEARRKAGVEAAQRQVSEGPSSS